jgi:hypothetical protein
MEVVDAGLAGIEVRWRDPFAAPPPSNYLRYIGPSGRVKLRTDD